MSLPSSQPPNAGPSREHGPSYPLARLAQPDAEADARFQADDSSQAEDCATALRAIDALPRIPLLHGPTPVDEANRLRERLGMKAGC